MSSFFRREHPEALSKDCASIEEREKEKENLQPTIDTLEKFMLYETKELKESFLLNAPNRWYNPFTVRCANGHVSTKVLRCFAGSGYRCLTCYGLATITFPEDKNGPLMSFEEFASLKRKTSFKRK